MAGFDKAQNKERPETLPLELLPLSSTTDHDDISSVDLETVAEKFRAPKSRGLVYFLFISMDFAGLQLVFALLSSYGSMFSVGLGKTATGLVWLAGPIAGTFVQPYLGARSDKSRSRWGKRRGFIAGGGIGIVLSLLLLGWAPDLLSVDKFGTAFSDKAQACQWLSVALTILSMLTLQAAVQPVQVGLRALIIDTCPPHQQSEASAWAARMVGVGNLLGQLAGSTDLPKLLPFFPGTQFKDMCVLTSIALAVTFSATCILVREKAPLDETAIHRTVRHQRSSFQDVSASIRRLPPTVINVWKVQFFSWMGWFPFIYYITTYVNGLSLDEMPEMSPGTSSGRHMQKQTRDDAMRSGSRAMLLFACVSLLCNAILPRFVIAEQSNLRPASASWHVPRGKLTLPRLWAVSQVLFSICMISTLLVSTSTGATVLVGVLGVSWSCTIWIPFAIVSRKTSEETLHSVCDASGDATPKPGLMMSLHNVSIAAPQILTALVTALEFYVSKDASRGVAYVLSTGGCFGLVAAYLAAHLETATRY